MQKAVVREINNGSWRSTEDYGNIINMTNIYKIVKPTTIENGIKCSGNRRLRYQAKFK